MKKTLLAQAILFSTLTMLTACGGGGGGGSSSGDNANNGGQNSNNGGGPSCDAYINVDCFTNNNTDIVAVTNETQTGNLIVKELVDDDLDNITDSTKTYTYNNQAKLISLASVNSAGFSTTTNYVYNGNQLQSARTTDDTNTYKATTYTYTANGEKETEIYGIADASYNMTNPLTEKRYTYENGKIKTEIKIDNSNSSRKLISYHYNSDNKLSYKISDDPADYDVEYIYDCNGNLSKENYFREEDANNQIGNVTVINYYFEKYYNSDNKLVSFKEFDDIGNQTLSVDKKPYCSIESNYTVSTDEPFDGNYNKIVKYIYDANNKLVQIEIDGGSVTRYEYDGNSSIIDQITIGK